MGKDEKMIIYQVFTRLFGNNHNHCINNGNITENGCGKMADFTAKALNEIKDVYKRQLQKDWHVLSVFPLAMNRST